MWPRRYSSLGVLREKIERGDNVDVFASADITQPEPWLAPTANVLSGNATRNRLCASGRASVGITTDNLLDRFLDPSVRLATSTPGADPGGDYAWAVFARAEAVHPGAQVRGKGHEAGGRSNSTPSVPGRGAVQGIFLADRANAMLGDCSSSEQVMRRYKAS